MNSIEIPHKGSQVELEIESLAFGGPGIAHIGEMVVFVKNAIPGQRVLARILKKKKSYLEATRLEIVRESEFAVPVACGHFDYCGGCTFQNLGYEKQLEEKQSQVENVMTRLGGFSDVPVHPIVPCDPIFNYRNKMEFTFSTRRWAVPDEKNVTPDFALGLHVPGRYDKILNIDHCSIQQETANGILALVKRMALDLDLTPYDIKIHQGFLRILMIKAASITGEIMVNFVTSAKQPDRLQPIVDALVENFPEITCIVNNVTSRKAGVSFGEYELTLYGENVIRETLGEYTFEISANSFFQTNSLQAKKLYELAEQQCNLTGAEIVYDLFCGTGSIGIFVSAKAKQVYGFEIVGPAVKDARRNAKINDVKNTQFFQGNLDTILSDEKIASTIEPPDVIVLDPPRAGLHPNTVKDILKLLPERIVYISCNPSTQARDLKLLCDTEYDLIHLQPVDMFPHTPHVENIATLVKK